MINMVIFKSKYYLLVLIILFLAAAATTTARKLLKVDVSAQLAATAVNAAARQYLASIGISTRFHSYNTSDFVQQWPDHSPRLNNRTILKGAGGFHLLKDRSSVL